jgi:hypothetical protein
MLFVKFPPLGGGAKIVGSGGGACVVVSYPLFKRFEPFVLVY